MNIFLLDLHINREKMQSRIFYMLGFDFKIPEIIIGKSLYITILSVITGAIIIFTNRILNQELIFRNGHIFIEAFLIDFCIVFFTAILYIKFEDSRLIYFAFFLIMLLVSKTKHLLLKLIFSYYFHIILILLFLLISWLLIEFLKRRKNDFFF